MVSGSSQTAGKRYIEFGFVNNKAILLIFYAKFTESMLDAISFPEFTMGPSWLGGENFSK